MLGNPLPGPHIGVLGHSRAGAGHVSWSGQPCFRITQRFTDINPALPQFGRHNALDIANHNCGAPVYASRAGMAYTLRDIYGALIVKVEHDAQYFTTYGHLARYGISNGQYVKKGQIIGYNGTTGLSQSCHLHFELWRYNVRVDPWPMLDQNQAAPAAAANTIRVQGVPMTFTYRAGLKASIAAGKPRRSGATLASGNYGNTTKVEGFPIFGEVKGQDWGRGPRWFWGPQYIGGWKIVYIPIVDLINRNF